MAALVEDVDRDAPLWENAFPVRCAARVINATVRLLSGWKGDTARQPFIYLEIADESDPYFHHSLALTEVEFQELRAEQSILVDFGAFPAKVVELLERCVAAAREDNPR